MNQQDSTITEKIEVAKVGADIGLYEGVQMIDKFKSEKGFLISRYFGKEILIQILQQPNCEGINITTAKKEDGSDCYVLIGIDANTDPIYDITIVEENGKLMQKAGIVADRDREREGSYDWFRKFFW